MSKEASEMSSILIVEDEAALNDAFTTVLKSNGFNVVSAFNGKEALEATQKEKFDVILLDLLMPVMDGIEFLKEYEPKDEKAYIVVFSNLDSETNIEEVYDLGANRYVLKSWASPKELVKIVKDALKQKNGTG